MPTWQWILVIFGVLFIGLATGLIIVRGRSDKLIEDLKYARHIIVVWFVTLSFRLFFWWLELIGHLQIRVDDSIPWNEKILIFAGNHPLPKLQDAFMMSIVIYYLKLRHYLNPIRYFPITIADEINFGRSPFFAIIGDTFIISVNRGKRFRRKDNQPWTLYEVKKRLEENGGGRLVFFPEGGRTLSAQKNRKELRESPEGSRLATPLDRGAARLSLDTGAPIVLFWSSINGDDPPAKPNLATVLLGVVELLLPGKKLVVDIGHPSGVMIPKPGETDRELADRMGDVLLELGDHQRRRIKVGKG